MDWIKTDNIFLALALLCVAACQVPVVDQTYHLALMHSRDVTDEVQFVLSSSTDSLKSETSTPCNKLPNNSVTELKNLKYLVNMTDCPSLNPESKGVSRSGIKFVVRSDASLQVVQKAARGGRDSFVAIPDSQLGTEYYIGTYYLQGGVCQLAVTPTQSDTLVTIFLPDGLDESFTCQIGSPVYDYVHGKGFRFVLHEFEVFHYQGNRDLSGTFIVSNNTVSVIVGSKYYSSENTGLLVQQIPPTISWGSEFVILPNPDNDQGDIVKIVPKYDSTRVYITGHSPFIIPKAGLGVERRIDRGMNSVIRSSLPILVLQVMFVGLYNLPRDVPRYPMMLLVSPLTENLTLSVPDDFFGQNIGFAIIASRSNFSLDSEIKKENIFVTKVGTQDFKLDSNLKEKTDAVFAYIYNEDTAVAPFGVTWTQTEQISCHIWPPVPGDLVDNDCDCEIDEDVCSEEDMVQEFFIESSDTELKIVKIEGWATIPFTVIRKPESVVFLAVVSEQNGMQPFITTLIPNERTGSFWPINITTEAMNLTLNIIRGNDNTPPLTYADKTTTLQHDATAKYLVASTLIGSANYSFSVTDKDCKGTISGVPDSFGTNFLAPCFSGNCSIFVTAMTHASVELWDKDKNKTFEVGGGNTLHIEWQATHWVHVTSDEEVSVSIHEESGYGTRLIPTDVQGPNYGTRPEQNCSINLNTEEWTPTQCFNILEAYPAFAYVCGPGNNICRHVQIPPRETLGKVHYIPQLALLGDTVTDAGIMILATEDSTVVTIWENYTSTIYANLQLSADVHSQQIKLNTTYKIEATKSVHVILLLNIQTSVRQLVNVPSIDQYRPMQELTFTDSQTHPNNWTGISKNGIIYDMPPALVPVFGLWMVKNKYILAGEQNFTSINTICKVSRQIPGDGEDNDCDGLVDEETRSITLALDLDIDGAIQEDCHGNVSDANTTTKTLTCTDTTFNSANVTVNSSDILVKNVTAVEPDVPPPSSHPNQPNITIYQSVLTIRNRGTVNETCLISCMCPCSWLEPPKDNPAQIAAKVKALQDKLRVDKKGLSATLRKLHSAPDGRRSATAIGAVGIGFIVAAIGCLFLLDLPNIFRDLRRLRENVAHLFPF
ncbi:uncharacterized protein LOC128205352 [Mya arenaria]|uniref:uncharacterized protein LOC128205352 n=1 Tax=Mya arenaria TaxID=6604 RepID=UPI0022E9280B|nr:uncharacterized protein LOC128205352 [Mya arenaria]